MNLSQMRAAIRLDLRDDSSELWSDSELDRCLAQALGEFSRAVPRQLTAALATSADSRQVDISSLTGRISVAAVEYPLAQSPPAFRIFTLWADTLTILGRPAPAGDDCTIHYGSLHTLDEAGSTVPGQYEDLVAAGAAGYAATAIGGYTINRVNVGGAWTPRDWERWANQKLTIFRLELKALRRQVRAGQLFSD